ncbi:hypothetical protein ACFQY4_08710 [Catellatospora bangladeshensis]|uniref:hypothetical protein n=1 Tax=Catellatospora bangladeshensis TaxID=310355 RepID=UPI00360BCD48
MDRRRGGRGRGGLHRLRHGLLAGRLRRRLAGSVLPRTVLPRDLAVRRLAGHAGVALLGPAGLALRLAVDLALLRALTLRRAVRRLALLRHAGLPLRRAVGRLALRAGLVGAAVDLALLRALTLLRAGALLRVATLLRRAVRAGALLRVRLVGAAVDLALLRAGALRAVLRAGLGRHGAGAAATLRAGRVRVPVALLGRALPVGGRERAGRRALAGVRLAVLLRAVGVRLVRAGLARLLALRRLLLVALLSRIVRVV